MKIRFEKLKYQEEAVDAVIDVLEGIETQESLFDLDIASYQQTIDQIDYAFTGEANRISQDEWFKKIAIPNIEKIQAQNDINDFYRNYEKPIFDIEMETGTGKTYVFLKTILKLNQKYGFKKFIILVPSIAIKEGVKKNLEITKEHFKDEFGNLNYTFYREYEGSRFISIINDFARSNKLEILIMNIQQINKDLKEDENSSGAVNTIYVNHDLLNGQKPIDLIRQTNPIVIIDEPQKTDSGKKSKPAIEKLNPLFTLRYSATFNKKDRANLLYKLDAVEAYNQKIVKQIVVHAVEANDPSIDKQLISLDAKKQRCWIKLLEARDKWTTEEFGVRDVLYEAVPNPIYKDFKIVEIDFKEEKVIFKNGEVLQKIDRDERYATIIKTALIRKTIEIHLDRELSFLKQKKDIKVLSLFFLDRVKNYRVYDENKNSSLGPYAQIFETEFIKIASQEKYKELFKKESPDKIVSKVHGGYFSGDPKKKSNNNEMIFEDTSGNKGKEDQSAYETIMKDKEWLLSKQCKLKFIFSHSALREGWDNPNVFQICTLNDAAAKMDNNKRQQIGRGLRLCVDQSGARVEDENGLINRLSLITTESVGEFAKQLQKNLEDEGINFYEIKGLFFTRINGISNEVSRQIVQILQNENFINKDNKELNKKNYSKEIFLNKLEEYFPNQFSESTIKEIVKMLEEGSKPDVIDGNEPKRENQLKLKVLNDPEFRALWNKINQKTIYKFKFNSDKFIKKTKDYIKEKIDSIGKKESEIITRKSDIAISNNSGVKLENEKIGKEKVEFQVVKSVPIKNLIELIENKTHLTKRTIARILNEPEIISYIKSHYNSASDDFIDWINYQKTELMVEGIEYQKVENDYYELGLFELDSLELSENVRVVEVPDNDIKTPFKYILIDSDKEKEFADHFLTSNVKKFLKMPSWFKIATPLGRYNPDWAIYDANSLALVVETKGSKKENNLRRDENLKIKCATKHFKALREERKDPQYQVESEIEDVEAEF